MIDPEARLAAALDEVYERHGRNAFLSRLGAKLILAADPTLICPDPDAHYAETRRLNRMFEPGVKVEDDPADPEGTWFTVDSLAAALGSIVVHPMTSDTDAAAAIIKAAKEAERG